MEELTQASSEIDMNSIKISYFLEIELYDKKFKPWEDRAKKIVKRYRDERSQLETGSDQGEARYNILWSNIQTMLPNVYARLPKPDVSRRYKDKDPVGRVASTILERALEYEIEAYTDYGSAVRNCVEDRLLPGRGIAWVRYEPVMKNMEMPLDPYMNGMEGGQLSEDIPAPTEVIDYECSPVDYIAWRDFGHNVARTWEEVSIVWRIVPLNREELIERFGEEIGKEIPLDTKPGDKDTDVATPEESAKMKANIYEVWDKNEMRVVWLSKRYDKALDVKDDPLGLDRFFPCPKPIYATTTTDSLIPVPDYYLYQDLAKELDTITNRINGLAESIKVVGVYDSGQTGIKRMLKEGVNTELIPVDNWAMFGEKGGIKGVIDWLPLDQVVGALEAAYKARHEAKQAVYEIMGIADVLRGSSDPAETLGAQQIKGQFASKRLKFMQKAVSEFATELLRIKSQIICNHYQPQTILIISGAAQLSEEDKQYIPQALELLRDDVMSGFRIEVSSDSLIEIDEAQEKQDRMEFLTVLSQFVEKAVVAPPALAPVLGEALLFMVRGFKVGKGIEGQIEEALDGLREQAKQPQPPDPAVQQQQQEMQMEQGKMQAQQQLEMAKLQAQSQSEQQRIVEEQNIAQVKAQSEMQIESARLESTLQIERERMENELLIERERLIANRELELEKMQLELTKTVVEAETNLRECE